MYHQKMHIPNFYFFFDNHVNWRLIYTRYRFYYRVISKVYPREELLTMPNCGGENFYPDDDIEL